MSARSPGPCKRVGETFRSCHVVVAGRVVPPFARREGQSEWALASPLFVSP